MAVILRVLRPLLVVKRRQALIRDSLPKGFPGGFVSGGEVLCLAMTRPYIMYPLVAPLVFAGFTSCSA